MKLKYVDLDEIRYDESLLLNGLESYCGLNAWRDPADVSCFTTARPGSLCGLGCSCPKTKEGDE